MTLYDLQNLGIINRIWKRCSTTITTYPIKNVISDLNDALDWYFSLFFKSAKNIDDINESSPPIDTQNIVSGTNRYKVSTFTEKIINFIKLEILDSDGNGHELISEDIGHLGDTFQELYLNTTAQTGIPTHYCKYGDFIYLRPTPDYSESLALKVYFNRPASKFEFILCTVTAATDLINKTAHGLSAGDAVLFETAGTIPAGITADTIYYVIASGLTVDVFKVSTTYGGSTIDITDTGTGNVYFIKLNIAPGIQETHHPHLITYVSKTYLNDNNQKLLGTLPTDVMLAEKNIREDYLVKNKDERNIMTLKQRCFR